jgi:stage V sporulation protein B
MKLSRAVILNVLGQAAALFIGFFTSILLARVLGPSDRGLLALMSNVSYLSLLVTGAGIPVAISYYAGHRESRPAALLGNSLLYAAVLAVVLIPAAALLQDPIADAVSRGRGGSVWVLAAALVPVTFLDWAVNNQLAGSLRFERFNILLVAGKTAYLICVVVLLGFLGLGVAAGLLALAAGSGVIIIGAMGAILKLERPPRVDRPLLKRELRYGLRVQVGAMSQLAVTRIDVLIVQIYRPLADVGYYVVAQTIAELPMVLALAFKTSILPLIARAEGSQREDTTALAIRAYWMVAAIALIGNAGLGTLVIVVGYGSEFEPAVVPMLLLLPGVLFLGLGVVVSGDLQGRGRPSVSSSLAGMAAVITVGLDFALVPPYGVTGAAVASLIAYALYGTASVAVLARVADISLRELLLPRRADFEALRAFISSRRKR